MGQGNKQRKPGRYANGAKISSAKKAMQGQKAKTIRRNADNLRNGLERAGVKKPAGTEAGHSSKGKSYNGQKGGWEKVPKNRAVESKGQGNKNRKKLSVNRRK